MRIGGPSLPASTNIFGESTHDPPGGDGASDMLPDASSAADRAGACRPFHAAGAVVDCIRERLAAHAASLGWRMVPHATADVHLLVDGRRVDPAIRGLAARFAVPAGARSVWVISDAVAPAEVEGGRDRRALGVCIGGLAVDDGFAPLVITADDPRLCLGFHEVEAGPQRWTGPRARLPCELWAHCADDFFLRLEMTRPALPRWSAPATERDAAGSTTDVG